jgi:hypothetical protein
MNFLSKLKITLPALLSNLQLKILYLVEFFPVHDLEVVIAKSKKGELYDEEKQIYRNEDRINSEGRGNRICYV